MLVHFFRAFFLAAFVCIGPVLEAAWKDAPLENMTMGLAGWVVGKEAKFCLAESLSFELQSGSSHGSFCQQQQLEVPVLLQWNAFLDTQGWSGFLLWFCLVEQSRPIYNLIWGLRFFWKKIGNLVDLKYFLLNNVFLYIDSNLKFHQVCLKNDSATNFLLNVWKYIIKSVYKRS